MYDLSKISLIALFPAYDQTTTVTERTVTTVMDKKTTTTKTTSTAEGEIVETSQKTVDQPDTQSASTTLLVPPKFTFPLTPLSINDGEDARFV